MDEGLVYCVQDAFPTFLNMTVSKNTTSLCLSPLMIHSVVTNLL